MRVAVYTFRENGLSRRTIPQMAHGIHAAGDRPVFIPENEFVPAQADDFDAACFWGYIETLQAAMREFTARGKPVVYLDLGYWQRDTHFKVSVGARHPTTHFQKVKHSFDRFERLGVAKPKPWKINEAGHILIAALSKKAAWAEHAGEHGEFEREVVQKLRAVSSRPITIRHKTSPNASFQIPGTTMSTLREPLGSVLNGAWALVTRHSNVAVDALMAGIPCFSWYGVGSVLSSQDLEKIEAPIYPEGREQWAADVAYCQWTLDEMRDGTVWFHLRNEGLLGS